MNNEIKHRKLGTEPLVGMYYVSECIKCGWIGSSGELTEDDAQCHQPVGGAVLGRAVASHHAAFEPYGGRGCVIAAGPSIGAAG